MHNPPVLILDEPTDGLDPNQKSEVRQLINDMASDKIIIISTHILEEVDAVCSRAVIIADGKIVLDETPQELLNRSPSHNAVTVKLSSHEDLDSAKKTIRTLDGVADVTVNETELSLLAKATPGASILMEIAQTAFKNEWRLEDLHLETGHLDEVFRDITMGKSEK